MRLLLGMSMAGENYKMTDKIIMISPDMFCYNGFESCKQKNCKYCIYNPQVIDEHDKEIKIKIITKCKDLVRDAMVDLGCVDATKYGNKNAKQQENSYSTIMKYEIADELDSLLDWMEDLKDEH